mmetsp:Transcript_23535/g.41572  ORF Transcript_23535/g.41572 Transcript_23535/m.41572 type:complete len:214 (+) Transcript_23535:990-1631(+)
MRPGQAVAIGDRAQHAACGLARPPAFGKQLGNTGGQIGDAKLCCDKQNADQVDRFVCRKGKAEQDRTGDDEGHLVCPICPQILPVVERHMAPKEHHRDNPQGRHILGLKEHGDDGCRAQQGQSAEEEHSVAPIHLAQHAIERGGLEPLRPDDGPIERAAFFESLSEGGNFEGFHRCRNPKEHRDEEICCLNVCHFTTCNGDFRIGNNLRSSVS